MDLKTIALEGKIKYLVLNMATKSRIVIIISLVVIDMPSFYEMLLGHEWIDSIRVLINLRLDTIIFPNNKYLIIISREGKYKGLVHSKDDNEANTRYVPRGLGTYTVF